MTSSKKQEKKTTSRKANQSKKMLRAKMANYKLLIKRKSRSGNKFADRSYRA